jgi:hypothetical protein
MKIYIEPLLRKYISTNRLQHTALVESSIINQFFTEMAKTKEGKKIVEVRSHYRKLDNGKKVLVREHRKSTPN